MPQQLQCNSVSMHYKHSFSSTGDVLHTRRYYLLHFTLFELWIKQGINAIGKIKSALILQP